MLQAACDTSLCSAIPINSRLWMPDNIDSMNKEMSRSLFVGQCFGDVRLRTCYDEDSEIQVNISSSLGQYVEKIVWQEESPLLLKALIALVVVGAFASSKMKLSNCSAAERVLKERLPMTISSRNFFRWPSRSAISNATVARRDHRGRSNITIRVALVV
jgi:hypothetical protein